MVHPMRSGSQRWERMLGRCCHCAHLSPLLWVVFRGPHSSCHPHCCHPPHCCHLFITVILHLHEVAPAVHPVSRAGGAGDRAYLVSHSSGLSNESLTSHFDSEEGGLWLGWVTVVELKAVGAHISSSYPPTPSLSPSLSSSPCSFPIIHCLFSPAAIVFTIAACVIIVHPPIQWYCRHVSLLPVSAP
jgi:hypothetical protein